MANFESKHYTLLELKAIDISGVSRCVRMQNDDVTHQL